MILQRTFVCNLHYYETLVWFYLLLSYINNAQTLKQYSIATAAATTTTAAVAAAAAATTITDQCN